MDEEITEEINIPQLIQAQNKKKAKGGGFQALGLSRPILKGILHKGYRLPTPIQRKTIPLILDGKDVVAMARTGSGKTAAFLIPLFEKLKIHASKVGARALILSPTRELALQTLTFAKELGKCTGLRAAAILGGESMEVQFAALHENPDIIIATPGRFTHICVEMNLKLDTVEYVVFDEADRLFEMGFKEQLSDVLKRLSSNRQTVLFSATLPKILVEFARAGLSDPTLIRLDAETKLSENLKLGFFKVNSEDKLPFLLHLLENVIAKDEPTVLFVPTRHHVEYIYGLLTSLGFSATYVFSSLDASARKINIAKFRAKRVNLLIVTDIAARGLDIPLLDNVINYNFPPKAKLFVHRVGRVARAGRPGTAYSLVSSDELCYLLELHMFLSKSVKLCPVSFNTTSSHDLEQVNWDRMLGAVPRDIVNENEDFIRNKLNLSWDLKVLKKSAENGFEKYKKTCPSASRESQRRLKEELWGSDVGFHPLFKEFTETPLQQRRLEMLEQLRNVRPKMTIFELQGKNDKKKTVSCFMQQKRKLDAEKMEHFQKKMMLRKEKAEEGIRRQKEAEEMVENAEEPSEVELMTAFNTVIGKNAKKKSTGANTQPLGVRKDPSQDFIPYKPVDYHEEQGYSLLSNFERETRGATLDLIGDDERAGKFNQPQMKWDRKLKRFKGQEQEKKIRTESGAWVSATYKKDLYQKWKLKMQPNQEEEEEEDGEGGGAEGEWRRDKRDWRGGKGTKSFNSKNNSFVSLTEIGFKNKAHPLVQNQKVDRNNFKSRGALQVKSYEQKIKDKKVKDKKMRLHKQKQMRSKKKKSK